MGKTVAITAIIIVLIAVFTIDNSNEKQTNVEEIEISKDQLSEEVYEPINSSHYKGNHLATGDIPYLEYYKSVYDRNIDNYLLIKNSPNTDVVVFLRNIYTDQIVRNVYIEAGKNYKIKNIPEGIYSLRCMYGTDWNPELDMGKKIIGGFESNISFSETDKSDYFDMRIQRSESGLSIPYYTITLYQVRNGNLSMKSINRENFF